MYYLLLGAMQNYCVTVGNTLNKAATLLTSASTKLMCKEPTRPKDLYIYTSSSLVVCLKGDKYLYVYTSCVHALILSQFYWTYSSMPVLVPINYRGNWRTQAAGTYTFTKEILNKKIQKSDGLDEPDVVQILIIYAFLIPIIEELQ